MTTLTEPIARLLSRDRPLILDGGLATELEAQGHVLDSRLWSARLLLDNPRTIVDAHRAYLEAGANCIISASYQATRSGLMSLGLNADQAQALVVESVDLAKTARDEFLRDQPGVEFTPLVAASIGPYGAPLGDGSEYSGDYGVDDRDLREFHEQRLAWLDASGADVLACETIPSRQESLVLCELLKHVSTPAWVSFSCKDGRHCNDGTPLAECAVAFRDHPRVFAVGVNCTSPQYVDSLIGEINSAATGMAIVVYPNSGEHYEASDNSWLGTSSPVECGAAAIGWRAAGAAIIGGCCRMGPDHIREIARAFAPGRETL